MAETIQWGILGTGNIAKQFAKGLEAIDDARLVAVGSRAQAKADAFGEQFDVPRRHATYEALAADADVDAIYIATPHPMHKPNALLCLDHGKAVLCEKPFTINAGEAREVVAKAKEKNVFLMEAMWTRFFPVMAKVREWIADGKIGQVRMIQADFGFKAGFNPESRLFNPELGGGALLDVGVYPISFASMAMGGRQPSEIKSAAFLGETGVDEMASAILQYDQEAMAVCRTSVRSTTQMAAVIEGSEGMIVIPPLFWQPDRAILRVPGQDEEEFAPERVGNGYNYQAQEVMACLRQGRTQSEVMSWAESIAVMETLDKIRAQWGLKYPMEQ